jgi:hypothetical protein
MFKKAGNFLALQNQLKKKILINTNKHFVSTSRFHTNFDNNLNWLKTLILGNKISIAKFFAIVNFAFFLYTNFRYKKEKRVQAIQGVSYSLQNLKNKDYIPLFASLLGSYRLDDLVLETGILLTIGQKLERLHGSPFVFKMFLFSFYIGFLSSLFFVKTDFYKNSRYRVEDPLKRNYGAPENVEYRYMSAHGFSMSLLYFYLFKTKGMIMWIPPLLIADLFIWGPYYSSGALTGLAAGMIL